MSQSINITIPPGPLGVGIISEDGNCVISSKSNQSNSPLMVDDIIISLNGIKLSQIEGGVDGWVRLFQMFGQVQRNLVVQRDITNNSSSTNNNSSSMTNGALKDSTNHDSSPTKKQKIMKQEKKTSTNNKLSTGMEVISLLSDDEDEESGTLGNKSGGAATAAATASRGSDKNVLDRDVLEVPMAPAWRNAATSDPTTSRGNLKDDNNYNNSGGKKKSNEDDEDEELTVIATKGSNALADFPHSRENCVTHPFSGDKKLHCSNCYCYVCDKPAKDCTMWASHCSASHSDPRWRRERELAKHRARELEAAPVQPPVPAAAARPLVVRAPAVSSRTANRRSADFSIRRLLERVTTVHPVEIQPPVGSGFVTNLRHYQKQSLAFMVETERTHSRGGWLSDEVGMGKSAITLALVAANPRSTTGLATQQQIQVAMNEHDNNVRQRQIYQMEHDNRVASMREAHFQNVEDEDYNRQYYAFRQIENQEKNNLEAKMSSLQPVRKIKVKTTVILTSCSLLGQWEDEFRKHSPGLTVKIFHNSRKKRASTTIDLRERRSVLGMNSIDVIISTSTFLWPPHTSFIDFHRVVHDESHLFIKGASSAKIDYANNINSSLRWGVTATPATSAATDLSRQIPFIQGKSQSVDFQQLQTAIRRFNYNPSTETLDNLVDLLKTFMVRHTKSQRINGSAALALPPSTTSTIMLDMTQDEKRAFHRVNTKTSTFQKHLTNGAQRVAAERDLVPQMSNILKKPELCGGLAHAISGYDPDRLSKIVALRKDLATHRRTETALRAVVFTQHVAMHEACIKGLKEDGFDIKQFTGSTSASKRDSEIRTFQNTSNSRPAVFVITLKSGNVGITLTAASRVYLLEPALDPAVEVQAAGRIHRLGQDKPCHVVKFAFKNSYEANTIELHKKIAAGKVTIVDGWLPPEAMAILAKGI